MSVPRSTRIARTLLSAAALALAPAHADAGPRDPLYRWTDTEGAVRYTTELERIPESQRGGAVRVEVPPEPEPPMPSLAPESPDPIAPEAGSGLPAVEASQAANAPVAPSPLDARIAALEREIAADEATLTRHISDPERAPKLATSEEIAAIAERLPRLQAELRTLRAQQAGEAGAQRGAAERSQ